MKKMTLTVVILVLSKAVFASELYQVHAERIVKTLNSQPTGNVVRFIPGNPFRDAAAPTQVDNRAVKFMVKQTSEPSFKEKALSLYSDNYVKPHFDIAAVFQDAGRTKEVVVSASEFYIQYQNGYYYNVVSATAKSERERKSVTLSASGYVVYKDTNGELKPVMTIDLPHISP